MNRYEYQTRAADGSVISREIEAASLAEAISVLTAEGIPVEGIRLAVDEASLVSSIDRRTEDGLRIDDEFSDVLQQAKERLPVLREACQDMHEPLLKYQLQNAIDTIEHAESLSQLMEDPLAGSLVPAVIRVGRGSNAQAVINHWVTELVNQAELKRRSWLFAVYPLVFMILVGIILVGLSLFVLPVFRDMYDEFGLSLPWVTEVVLLSGEQISLHSVRTLVVICVICAMVWGVLRLAKRFSVGNRYFTSLFAGTDGNLVSMEAFTSTLAELIEVGTVPARAVRLAGVVTGNAYYRVAAEQIAECLEEGQSSVPVQSQWSVEIRRVFPATLLHLLTLDISSPSLANCLRQLASVYAQRRGNRLDWLLAVLPSLVTVAIGVMIGLMILALFLPLVRLIYSLAW